MDPEQLKRSASLLFEVGIVAVALIILLQWSRGTYGDTLAFPFIK
jgi:hypothetical protein